MRWTCADAESRTVTAAVRKAAGSECHPDFVPQAGDIIIKEHWAQNDFANTDLDFQLKQHGINKVIVIGLLANTCIEATGRYAMARLPRNTGEGRNRSLLQGSNVRCARSKRP